MSIYQKDQIHEREGDGEGESSAFNIIVALKVYQDASAHYYQNIGQFEKYITFHKRNSSLYK